MVHSVLKWPVPTSSKDVERFLGFVNYHRSFIKEFAHRAGPLHEITGKRVFNDLIAALTTAPVLAIPNANDLFILDTDASAHAIGAELIQVQDGQENLFATTEAKLRKYFV